MAVEDMLSDIRREQAEQASTVRREAAEHTNEIVREGMKGDFSTQGAINSLERANSQQIDAFEDVTNANFFTVARDTQDIRAQVISAQQAMVTGFLGAAKDAEINALKTQVELAKQTTYLSDKIDDGNRRTVELVQALQRGDNERRLIERNTALVAALDEGRHWRHHADQGQWQALNNQLQAFQSQLQETRQGMVNFGTMAGVGQTSTSNNVR
jgi:hypothetical protein